MANNLLFNRKKKGFRHVQQFVKNKIKWNIKIKYMEQLSKFYFNMFQKCIPMFNVFIVNLKLWYRKVKRNEKWNTDIFSRYSMNNVSKSTKRSSNTEKYQEKSTETRRIIDVMFVIGTDWSNPSTIPASCRWSLSQT